MVVGQLPGACHVLAGELELGQQLTNALVRVPFTLAQRQRRLAKISEKAQNDIKDAVERAFRDGVRRPASGVRRPASGVRRPLD
jgi:hypothetical protein